VRKALAAALLGLAALTGCTASSSAAPKPAFSAAPTPQGTYRGLGLQPAQPRPTFTLTDTAGKPYDFAAETRGAPTLLYFGYTHCPDVCPTAMADTAIALRAVPSDLRAKVRVVFVTTDPARDTGTVIASWLRNFDTGLPVKFVGLTGTLPQVEAAQAAARIEVARDGGQTHSAEQLLYGPDDYARVAYVAGSSSDDLAHDLPIVAGS
jgi:protein SCO1/2